MTTNPKREPSKKSKITGRKPGDRKHGLAQEKETRPGKLQAGKPPAIETDHSDPNKAIDKKDKDNG